MLEAIENALESLPEFDDIRIEHKEAVLAAIELIEELKVLIPDAEIEGEHLLNEMLEKIIYLENEKSSDIGYTTVSPQMYDLFGESVVPFEGYFYNAKYIDKVLIEDTNGNVKTVEANIEYIESWKLNGKTYPAYKYNADIYFNDGYYIMKMIGISQSGVQTNTAARFSVDTTAPELDIEVIGVDENNETEEESVEVQVTMRDNFANLTLYVWDSYEFSKEYATSDNRFRQPAKYTYTMTLNLDVGKNEFPFTLVDEAGNETVRTIEITRIDQQPKCYAAYYFDDWSPHAIKTMLIVDNVENIEDAEDAVYFRAKYINDKGVIVSTNTVKLGEEVQVGFSSPNPKELKGIDIVIMDGTARKNILYTFENVDPVKIEK